MDITCVSDLHGYYPQLDGGDLLIIAGDLTASDKLKEYQEFVYWLNQQKYTKKVVISGNHDNLIEKEPFRFDEMISDVTYLCDSGTTFENLRIWGSPWTKTFVGMNPKCKAFTVDTEEELAEKWKLIPDDIDILITHEPPYGILDGIPKKYDGTLFHVGSKSLRKIVGRVRPKLWVCGHIHEGYGQFKDTTLEGIDYHIVNASHVNERYEPVNNPIRVIL